MWEENIDAMRDGACYQLKNFTIRDFQSTRYLSMSKEGTEITSIDDIGTVAQQSDTEEVITLENVMVIGVPHLNIYKGCLNCKARVEPLTHPLGRCSRAECLMMQRYDVYREITNAKLLLMYKSEGKKKMIQCHAFDDVVHEMAGGNAAVTQELLL